MEYRPQTANIIQTSSKHTLNTPFFWIELSFERHDADLLQLRIAPNYWRSPTAICHDFFGLYYL